MKPAFEVGNTELPKVGGVVALTVTVVKLAQKSSAESINVKALPPISVTLEGIVTLANFGQFANAALPMLVTPEEIVALVKAVQAANALPPMLVTLVGIVTLVKPSQL